jgi:hypothetical protein
MKLLGVLVAEASQAKGAAGVDITVVSAKWRGNFKADP